MTPEERARVAWDAWCGAVKRDRNSDEPQYQYFAREVADWLDPDEARVVSVLAHAIRAAIAETREACAQRVERDLEAMPYGWHFQRKHLAAAIRALGEPT